jgi:hypothetical protein
MEVDSGAGRELKGTSLRIRPLLYDTYWRFASSRQTIYFRRLEGDSPPWTTDPILAEHRFTNVFRASDRVSQFLINRVIYSEPSSPEDTIFRTLLFKFFNRIDTWTLLEAFVGEISYARFDSERWADCLEGASQNGKKLYSPAYIMPNPDFGDRRKHRNHLRLLAFMMRDGLAKKIAGCINLRQVFETLLAYPGIGPFLAFQYAIDLNYGPLLSFSEMDFVMAGPGAKRGISKAFVSWSDYSMEDVIRIVCERQEEEFEARSLDFKNLWGRPLQLIDIQNVFCEMDKYSRVAHADVGAGGRTRIKQKFRPAGELEMPRFPPKWGIDDHVDSWWAARC